VLLSPEFAGTEEQYAVLSHATGMVAYDLKTRLRPGAWGVVRALGDAGQAEALALILQSQGLPACLLDSGVGHDPERKIVPVRKMDLESDRIVLHLRERAIPVPYKALVSIVRGEVQMGRSTSGASSTSSSAGMRAVVPSPAEVSVFREHASTSQLDAFAAADLHFATVLWAARLDARTFEFSSVDLAGESPASDLDQLVDWLAERAAVRVDRSIRASSLASFTSGSALRRATPMPGAAAQPARPNVPPSDEHFDAYSRLVAEAERQMRGVSAGPSSSRPA